MDLLLRIYRIYRLRLFKSWALLSENPSNVDDEIQQPDGVELQAHLHSGAQRTSMLQEDIAHLNAYISRVVN